MRIRYYTAEGPELAQDALRRAEDAVAFYGMFCGGPIDWGTWNWDHPSRHRLPHRLIRFSEGIAAATPDVLEMAKSAVIPQLFRYTWGPLHCRLDPLPLIADSVRSLVRLEEIRAFFSESATEVTAEILDYLSANPDRLHDLPPRRFEELVGAAFANQGFKTVLTPYSGDEGVDLRIVGHDGIGEVVTLVQVKRYDPKYPIDLSVVQALSGAVAAERAHRGLVVTTSRYLPGVERWIEQHGVPVQLATSEHLVTWLRRAADAMRARLAIQDVDGPIK